MTTTTYAADERRGLSLVRCAATLGIGVPLFFFICWLGAQVGAEAPHAFIGLFTSQPLASGAALAEGLCWSLVFGIFAGALLAALYNGFRFLDRR